MVKIDSSDNQDVKIDSKYKKRITLKVILMNRTFNCKGHDTKLDSGGDNRKIDLLISKDVNILLFKKGQLVSVNYNYGNGKKVRWKDWTFISFDSFAVSKVIKSLGSESNQTLLEHGLKRYNGQYFSVEYPAVFLASPSGPIQSFNPNDNLEALDEKPDNEPVGDYYFINTDEAYFEAPDKSVEFFVYSPQWSGESESYRKVLHSEQITAHEEKSTIKKGVHYGHIKTDWVTLKARNGSYYRSYVHKKSCHTKNLKVVYLMALVLSIKIRKPTPNTGRLILHSKLL